MTECSPRPRLLPPSTGDTATSRHAPSGEGRQKRSDTDRVDTAGGGRRGCTAAGPQVSQSETPPLPALSTT